MRGEIELGVLAPGLFDDRCVFPTSREIGAQLDMCRCSRTSHNSQDGRFEATVGGASLQCSGLSSIICVFVVVC
jgi:hypothetical protein